jgi:hypothetical protein
MSKLIHVLLARLMQTKWVRVRRERVLAYIATHEWTVDSFKASNAIVFDDCHPCTRKHPGRCCLAPERPNPSSRAMYANCCCITARLHGTDERVPSGVGTSRRTPLASKVPQRLNKCRYIMGPLVAAFTKQGVFCLFHGAHSHRHAPASKCSPPSLKSRVSIAGTAWLVPFPASWAKWPIADSPGNTPAGRSGILPSPLTWLEQPWTGSSVGQNEQRSRVVTCGRRKTARSKRRVGPIHATPGL